MCSAVALVHNYHVIPAPVLVSCSANCISVTSLSHGVDFGSSPSLSQSQTDSQLLLCLADLFIIPDSLWSLVPSEMSPACQVSR
jgi:hypothetical protein